MKTFEGFYLKKDYVNALKTLEGQQKDIDLGLWHYNMGSVLAEMNNWPMARFHFLLSEKSGLNTKQLNQNLLLVEEKLDITRLEKPLSTSDYLLKASFVAADGLLVTLGFLILAVGIYFLKKKPSLKSAAIFVVAVFTPLMLDLWIDAWPRKIVTSNKVIYEGPSALFGPLGELPQGVMILTNEKDGWEEIIYPSRFAGWIKPEDLKSLELK